jgi:SAM-dependent methyltransferase
MSASAHSPDYLPEEYLKSHTERYNQYQQRYAEQPREGDKKLIELVRAVAVPRLQAGAGVALLDIGCSTGNLLFHLKQALPGLELVGGDLAQSAITTCRDNPRLSGIRFEIMDVLNLPSDRFDIVVANASTFFFSDEDYDRATASIARSLRKGGSYFSFEYLHPYEQNVTVIEKSRSFPDGLHLHFRPYSTARRILERQGFRQITFAPFSIPIDLAMGQTYSDNREGYEDLNSFTITTQSGERLLFRGTLFQPWCHMSAVKAD